MKGQAKVFPDTVPLTGTMATAPKGFTVYDILTERNLRDVCHFLDAGALAQVECASSRLATVSRSAVVEIAAERYGLPDVEPGPGCAWLLAAQPRLAEVELAAVAEEVTPEMVLDLKCPTRKFLCPLTANAFGMDFVSITMKDYDTHDLLFEVTRDADQPSPTNAVEDPLRNIQYPLAFAENVNRLRAIQKQLVFSVGNQEVQEFRVINRFWFRSRLIGGFDFTFGNCLPGSTNTWDSVYLQSWLFDDELVAQMVANPHESQTDEFFFVDGKLIMHQKASYHLQNTVDRVGG